MRAAAAADPDKVAVIAPEGELTYAALDRAADRLAAGLAGLGVRRSDRVALLFANSLEATIAIYAVWRAGAAISPLHPTVKAEKLAYVLGDAGARALVCDAERAETAGAAVEHAPDPVRVVVGAESVAGDGSPPADPVSVDLAGVVYTSGSTGEPKGVALTHANMTFVADSIIEYLEMGEADRVLCVMPLSFGYGLYQLLTCVRARATLVLEPGFAFAGRVVSVLEEQRITTLPGVPTVFQVLLSLKGLAERPLPDLRTLTNAGAPLPEPTARELRRAFPDARLYLMYGQTECQRVCYLPPDQVDERPTSVGIAIPGTEAWVEDADGNVAATGAVGELMIRGAHLMQGYWGKPEATAAKLRPGRWPWEREMASGDLFRRDEDGYLYFVSRRDDIIKSRGEKVVPREIEDILHQAAGVREAAVVGVPDRLLGEAVVAHVAPQSDHELDPGALRRLCAERLEDYMVPKQVVIHDELPRTGNGKLDRAALRGS
ncbi:MAG: AMP-binding protein [Solirubrobacterales bacterium]|nr:AMP-binding protein [Solirubrobacterales bacterium]